jgi:hypothetical protein
VTRRRLGFLTFGLLAALFVLAVAVPSALRLASRCSPSW